MMEIRKQAIRATVIMSKALTSNENRLNIICALYKKPMTWTELIHELRINPKSLRDHLKFLRQSHIVKKRRPTGFELTEAGQAFVELSLQDIIKISQQIESLIEQSTK